LNLSTEKGDKDGQFWAEFGQYLRNFLLCGLILLFQGWRLDPILQFGQFLLTGAAVFFAFETVKLRGLTTEQARRGTSFVDERPVSREYRAELEPLDTYEPEERYEDNPRLRGYEDPRSSRTSSYQDEEPRGTRTRRPADTSGRKTANRRPRNSSPTSDRDVYDQRRSGDDWEETSPRPRRRPASEDNRSILAIRAIEKIGRDRIIVNGSRVMIIRLGLIIKE